MNQGRLVCDRTVRRRLVFCGAALLLVTAQLIAVHCTAAPELSIYVLQVGQGDAVLVRSGGQNLLVDTGPNAAEYHLLGELLAMGIDRLDAVVFTHPDEDHIGGADVILDHFPIGRVYLPAVDADNESFSRLLISAARSGVPVEIAEAGARFVLGEAEVLFLGPFSVSGSANDSSAVVRVSCGATAALLMGDAEYAGEETILAVWPPETVAADLLKVGHHGAETSTSAALLDAVSPAFAAISCGKANDYGHPARRTVDALTARGIEIGRTDREGTLVYCSDGEKFWRER